jgi:hypothetical protein
MLSNSNERIPSRGAPGPAKAAWAELELWRPFLRQFPEGEAKFPHWNFWPSTVFTEEAASWLTDRF